MERRVLWLAMLVVGAMSASCGDDGGGDDDNNEAGRGGSDNAGRGGEGGGMIGGEGIACGTMRCQMPEGSTVEPCCYDMFDGICGMIGGFTGQNCVSLTPVDPRCPSVMVGPLTLENCCNSENMCGIQDPVFGGGCVELGEAARMAMERFGGGSDEDGGTTEGPGGMFMVNWPASQACGD